MDVIHPAFRRNLLGGGDFFMSLVYFSLRSARTMSDPAYGGK